MCGLKPPASCRPQIPKLSTTPAQLGDGWRESGFLGCPKEKELVVAHQDKSLGFRGSQINPSLRLVPTTFLSQQIPWICAFYCLCLVQEALGERKRKDKVSALDLVPVLGQTVPGMSLLFPERQNPVQVGDRQSFNPGGISIISFPNLMARRSLVENSLPQTNPSSRIRFSGSVPLFPNLRALQDDGIHRMDVTSIAFSCATHWNRSKGFSEVEEWKCPRSHGVAVWDTPLREGGCIPIQGTLE